MFTKKRIIIAVISAVLVAVLAVGTVFIVGGISGTPIENIVDSEAANADGNGDTTEKTELPIRSEKENETDKTDDASKEASVSDSFSSQSSMLIEGGTDGIYKETADEYKLPENYTDTSTIKSKKTNMPDVKIKINGKDLLFSYDYTESRLISGYNLNDKEAYITKDYYVSPEGYIANKYEEDNSFRYFSINDYSETPDAKLSDNHVLELARKVVEESDISTKGVLNSKSSVRKNNGRYYVDFATDTEDVSVTLGADGTLRLISVSKYVAPDELNERKEIARKKMNAVIEEKSKRDLKGKWVIEEEKFSIWGKKAYARFAVFHYLENGASMGYSYFCEL